MTKVDMRATTSNSRLHAAKAVAMLAGVSLGALALPSYAQDNNDQRISEGSSIVVTATRRGDQNILDVPMAIDAYSGDTLSRYAITSVQDLSKLTPSLNVVSLGGTQQRVVIRGISSSVGATTGMYVDEAPLLGPFDFDVGGDGTPSLRMHDIEHVEVLKGPQGTLFGAGSMAGTVRTVLNKPDLYEVQGAADASWSVVDGGNPFFAGSAMVSAPLVQGKVGMRLVAWTEQGGGYIDKRLNNGTIDEDANDIDLWGGRAMLRFAPSEDLTIDLTANYQKMKVDGAQYVTASVGFQDTPEGQGQYANYDPVFERYDETYQLYSAVADYDLGFGNIIASGSYGKKSLLDVIDTSGQACFFGLCAGTPAYPAAFTTDMGYHAYTGELRFSSKFDGPLQLVTGAYYQKDHRKVSGAALITDLDTGQLACDTYVDCVTQELNQPGFGNSPIIFADSSTFDVEQYAIYAQVDYEIMPTLTATVGGRYFHAKLSSQQTDQQAVYPDFIFGIISDPTTGQVTSATQDKPTWNFSLLWRPQSDFSIYARAASGFRIGGINNSAAIAAQADITIPASFEPDQLWNYEIGAKLYMLDRAVSVELSAYHIDWKGQQLNALAQGVFNYQLNAGMTKTDGFEFNTTIKPVPGLTLSGSVNYVDSKLDEDLPDDVVSGGTPGQSGDRIPYVSKWAYSARAEYETAISDTADGYIQTDVSYKGSSYTQFRPVTAEDIGNGIPDNYYTELPAYTLWNARLGVRLENFDVSLFLNNITNKFAIVGASSDVNSTRYFTARPRSVGVALSLDF